MTIKKQGYYYIALSLIVLSLLNLFYFQVRLVGGILLLANSIIYFLALTPILKLLKFSTHYFVKLVFLLAYYSTSLSVIYYIFGLSPWSISIWLIINFVLIFFLYYFGKINHLEINLPNIYFPNNKLKSLEIWLVCSILFYLIIYFFSQPIINGNPSPWPDSFLFGFILFFLVTFLLLKRLTLNQDSPIISGFYFLLTSGLIAIRYVLSYGYDTLIHQGALNYILEYGQIKPLTPFYIGQYVLEIIIQMFSGLSFTFIERWLSPALLFSLLFFGGHYFLKRLKLKSDYLLAPISVILLFPDIFSYTSPYALALLWGLVAIMFIFLFLSQDEISDIKIAIICSLVSVFIHPFVGLNILIWSIGLYLLKKNKKQKYSTWWLGTIFISAAVAVILAFILYNWLADNGLNIYNPIYFINNFINIFTDPLWYSRINYSWWLGLIYFYERIHFFIVFLLALYWPLKRLDKTKEIIILISLSSLISAWLFVSSFKIDNYFYGDQVNYGYRLIQVAKWFIWPIILILLSTLFSYLKKIELIWRYLVISLLALIITGSWYLSYPRQDEISHMGINSVRQVDYQAIDFIYKNEGGKNGYVVLSNQIFGAGAILKYGFGPYYKTDSEKMLYYSLPFNSNLSKLYNKIMAADTYGEKDDISEYIQEIQELIKPFNLSKFYFVYNDAWTPTPKVIEQLNNLATGSWNIDNKIFILLITPNK